MPSNKELEQQLKESNESVADLGAKLDKVVASTNDALEGIEEKIDSNQSAILQAIQAQASNNPVSIKHVGQSEPMEQSLGEEHVAEFSTVDGDAVIEVPKLTDVSSPEFRTKLNMLEFNKEPVTIMAHSTSDSQADARFDVSVNGHSFVFVPGEQQTVPRYIAEQLCRAKPVHYENQQYTLADGSLGFRYPTRKGLRYPFSVIEDRNPSGPAWLKNILAQP